LRIERQNTLQVPGSQMALFASINGRRSPHMIGISMAPGGLLLTYVSSSSCQQANISIGWN
jgi:hypothetical protein